MRILHTLIFLLFTHLAWAQTTPGAAQEDFHKAIRLFDEGLFNQSAIYFERFITAHPHHPKAEEASYFFVLTRGETDSLSMSLYVERHVQKYPDGVRSADLLYEMGIRARKNAAWAESITWFDRALYKNIDDERAARAFYWMAESSLSLENYDQALDYFLELADIFPGSEWAPKALYARGRVNLSIHRYDASTDAFELLRERYPADPMTRRVGTALGESYYLQQRYQEAITALRNALPHLEGESESKAIFLIAESYNYLNQLDRAATFYRRFINLNPNPQDARIAQYGLGWVYHKQQVYHWAAEAFGNAAVGTDEFARKALYYKAINEKLGGRYDRAMVSFEEFGQRFQTGSWVETAYYEWAITAFQMGNHVKAIEVLQQLIRSGMELTKAGEIYTLLGEAYFANAEYTRSEQAFEQASRLTDVNLEIRLQAQFQRAWVQYENQAYEQAQQNFERLYRQNRNSPIAAEALFWSADALFQLEQYQRAAEQFRDFIQRYPDHEFIGAAKYALGWSYFMDGKFAQAVPPLRDFLANYEPPPIALFPYDVDAKLRIGDALFAQRKYLEAIDYYEAAVGGQAGGDYAIFQVANSFYRAEQTFEAVRNFRRLIRNYPESTLREQAQYNIGYIFFQTGNYTQAVEEFETVIRLFPRSEWAARARYNIGDAHFNAGNHEQAIIDYKRVLQEYPGSPLIIEAVNGIQFAQLAAGKEDTSFEILEDFLARHPQAGTADRLRFRQAENLLQAGAYEAAIRSFRQYLRITNSERHIADAYYNLSQAYERSGDLDNAITALEVIRQQHPRSDRFETSLLHLGRMYTEKQDFTNAVSVYEQLQQRTRRLQREANIGLGNTYLAMNNTTRAYQLFDENLRRNPDDAASMLGKAKVYFARSDYQRAERMFREIAEAQTGETGAEAQYLLGRVYQQIREYNDAIQAYSRVAILFEAHEYWVASANLRSAECYRALGNTTEARRVLERILQRFPNTRQAQQARDMLQSS